MVMIVGIFAYLGASFLLQLSSTDAFVAAPPSTTVTTTSLYNGPPPISSHPVHGGYSFDEIKSIESRLDNLERDAPDVLQAYYEPHLKSFSVRPGSVQDISVTSTCFSLLAIFATDDCSLFSNVVDTYMKSQPDMSDESDDQKSSSKIPIRGVVKALLRARWREEDLFQVPLLLYTVLKIDGSRSILNADMDEELCHRVKQLISATIDNRPKRRSGISQPLSDYILYIITDALAELVRSTPKDIGEENDTGLGGLPDAALPENAASSTLLALTRCVEVSYNELCRQLAYRSAGDMASFDIMRMAYSLLTYVKASNVLAGTAGIESIRGEGPESGTSVRPPNQRLVDAALAAFFAEQKSDGMFDQGQPIYKSFRRTGRDVGNAFVYAADTVGSLLGALPEEAFRPHLDGLNKLLSWIEQNVAVDIIPGYCDPITSQCYGKPLRGWESPHMTAQSSTGPLLRR